MIRKLSIPLVLFGAVALTACASQDSGHDMSAKHAKRAEHGGAMGDVTAAVASLQSKSGSSVSGWVRFEKAEGGLHVTAEVTGLAPNSTHAIHIHERGDCSSADGKSAGGHYNPGGHDHAGPDAAMRHAGDLGNLTADADGRATYERTIDGISIAGHHNPILGLAIIVHAGEDDLHSQPTGNAGGRLACGTIGIAK